MEIRTHLTAEEISKLSNKQLAQWSKAVEKYFQGNEKPLREWLKKNIDTKSHGNNHTERS